jgi:hypothetical protein
VSVVLFTVATIPIAYWIHHRDTTHGDHWDLSDWLECILASAAAGLLVAWGAVSLTRRVDRR